MSCSPARLVPHRANTQKSTGLKAPEGKAASRANALEHDLTGSATGLPPDDQAALEAHLDAWRATYPPSGPTDDLLLRQLAVCCLRIDRASAQAAAVARANHARDLALWDDDRDLAALDLIAALPDNPERTVRRLRRSSHSCALLAARWTTLLHGLDGDRCVWNDDDLGPALDLLGLPTVSRRLDPAAAWLKSTVAAARSGDANARASLRARIEDELAALLSRAEELVDGFESLHRTVMEEVPPFDFSPEAERIRRYEAAAWRQFWRLIHELDRRRAARPPARPPAPPSPKPPASPLSPLPKAALEALLRPESSLLPPVGPLAPRPGSAPTKGTQAAPFTVTRPPGPRPSERL